MRAKPGRLEKGILWVAVMALGLLVLSPFATHWLREPVMARSEMLPLSFPHSKHTKDISCQTCHHNFTDKTGPGVPCIHCHRSDHPDLKRGIEGEFHDFCKGCHADKARMLGKHGPVHECTACHKATADGFMP